MTEPVATRSRVTPRRVRLTAMLSVAVAIATVLGACNGTATKVAACAPPPGIVAAVDAAATGQLAALNGTGTGRSYADMKFLDPEGKPTSIAAFAGKKLLVNFWASWCIPCRAEMPALNDVAGKYNSDGFMVLPVNTGETQEGKAAAFLADANWPNLPLYVDPDFAVIDRLKTSAVSVGLPATVLLDETGCEIAVLQGPAEWNSPDGHRVIEALLGT